jgi:hypothetical protein
MITVISSIFAAVCYKQPSAVCESLLDHDAHCQHCLFFSFLYFNKLGSGTCSQSAMSQSYQELRIG